jgi:glycosyltransferase involved in cell wall biosynthesis
MIKDKLKIIIVHFMFSPYGGGEVMAYNTYKLLQQKGHEVYFYAMDYKPYFEECESTKYFCKALRKDNIIDYFKDLPKNFYNFDAAKKFGFMLDEIQPDIVHVHTLDRLTYSVLNECFKRNIHVVKTEHSVKIACPSESLFFGAKTLCKKRLCVKGNYFHCVLNKCFRKSYYFSIIRALSVAVNDLTGCNKKINKFIAPTNAVKEVMVQKGISADKIEIIENFISKQFENLEPCYENKNYFLFSGRLYNFKGLNVLFEAIKELPKEIEFHIAGTGPLENELKEICKINKLDNVKFLGFLSRNDLIEEYKYCRALIVPSIWFEIFGLIIIEAMSLGKPVIASNIGGIPEIVENNKTGLLFESEKVENIKECILKYFNNKDLAVQHGKNAYEKVINHYTEEKYGQKLIDLYREILTNE